MEYKTLEEALARIRVLEREKEELLEELEYYRNRGMSGRKKHNEKWMKMYNDFVVCFEAGMAIVDIAHKYNVSERTVYRYRAYYEEMKKKGDLENGTV